MVNSSLSCLLEFSSAPKLLIDIRSYNLGCVDILFHFYGFLVLVALMTIHANL
jgi:hypothetical protein